MKRIHPSIASHRLNVLPTARPQKVIRDEIDKLLEAGFIRDVEYPDWLGNVVVVPKKGGKWRMCVDYINLNNACPKDSFPLPRIDQITAFITPHGLYCYKVMPFGLKNTGTTYQRLMTKIFKPLVGRTVEVYVDDIVVKSKTQGEHALHLQEVFQLLRNYDMKLNPSKCAFGMSAGKFLGFMVSQRGIEVSPDQVKAVMETPPPRNKKELQRLTSKLAALGRFIARFTDELRPFFLAIRKAGASGWTDNCQSAFEKIKHYLRQPPILTSPSLEKNCICIWLFQNGQSASFYSAAPRTRSRDLFTMYSKMELTALALRSAAQKLRPYFQAHPVVVLTDQPLRNILDKPDLTGRMLQWTIELSEYGIECQPRLSMKGQACPTQRTTRRRVVDFAGLLLQSPTGEQLEQAIRLGFSASKNEAEYEAILSGLDLALALSVSRLQIYSDSQLVVRHVQKVYEAKNERMTRYLTKANQADGQDWTEAIIKYLRTSTLLEEPKQAHKTRVQAARFTLIGGHLYKRSFTGPYLRCLNHSKALYVLAELHEEVCGNHSGGRTLAHRAHSQGYYWPTMKKDAATYVKKCDKCQRHAPIPHVPSETLKPISGPWPFAQWGMDIVGPLPTAVAQKKFLLVATDYFSKWVEAEAYASIKDKDVTKFTIIADNDPQFDSITFRNFCSELNIRNLYSTPRYPQSNGQAEATNKTLIIALKKRLEQAKGKWVEELPGVLWAYRTTPGRPIGNTPFALAYGMDAVIPTEIGLPTIRTEAGP
uniref:Uncharacterized protein n=1 Tax=Vitis vinifera TaxID=29760 RepID=A5B2W0_VITVI|nr:hypothetical protein VITISV_024865 [Vitis vinifera]